MSIICRSCRNNIKINDQYQQNRVFSRQVRQFLVNDVALSSLFCFDSSFFSSQKSQTQPMKSARYSVIWRMCRCRAMTSTVTYMINSRMCRRCPGTQSSTSNNSIMNHRVQICVSECHEFTSSDQTSERWVTIVLFGPIRRPRCLHHNRRRRYHFRR